MANLDSKALIKLAQEAGFNQKDAPIAAAVALAESGGNPNAHNTKPPDDSYGLWQINMLGSLGPERLKLFGIKNNAELFDPKVNAKAAFKIYAKAGYTFRPWTTFTSGAYKNKIDLGVPGDVADKVSDVASAVPDAINAFGQTIFKGVSNLTGIVVAVVLLALGVVILLRSQIGSAAKTVGKVTPAGKVGSVAKTVGRVVS